jgi:hypothetical protein
MLMRVMLRNFQPSELGVVTTLSTLSSVVAAMMFLLISRIRDPKH